MKDLALTRLVGKSLLARPSDSSIIDSIVYISSANSLIGDYGGYHLHDKGITNLQHNFLGHIRPLK